MNRPYTAKAKKALALAGKMSRSLHHNYIGTEHLLLGLLREGSGVAACVLMSNGVEEEKLTDFEKLYDASAGEDTSLFVDNVASTRSFEVKTPDVVVKVNPERADLVNTMMVDGRKCLVIEINDQVEVNGISVKAFGQSAENGSSY